MFLVDRAKLRWHLDLASHPVTHGWVLNLYRAGEQHPETVADYFPAEHAPWPQLAQDMRRHAAEERGHVALYGRAISDLGEPVDDLQGADVYNEVIRDCTEASFAIGEEQTADQRRLALGHFLAHAHHLERRIARSLEYHLEACLQLARSGPAAAVSKVLEDEYKHVEYTGLALPELLTHSEHAAIMELHARGEEQANLLFSSIQVRRFLASYADHVSVPSRLLYCFGSWLMARQSEHV